MSRYDRVFHPYRSPTGYVRIYSRWVITILRPMTISRPFVVAMFTGLFLGMAGMYAFFGDHFTATGGFKAPEGEGEAAWFERIQEIGGKRAYEEFSESLRPLSREQQHAKAHEFGAALFHAEGEQGLAVCDSQFSFGCFHEFLGRAIGESGLPVVERLNEGCRIVMSNNVLACQHGIGHGVLAAIGYESSDLDKALETCAKLPYIDPIGGCYGGVFMEYNVRTMLGADASAREDEGGPLQPCNRLPADFRHACFYWQPQWWEQYIFRGEYSPETHARMGEFCLEVGSAADRRACFEGVGNITATAARYEGARAAELCDAVSDKEVHRTLCRSVAANHLGLEKGEEDAARACAGLSEDSEEYCLKHASNIANIANLIPLPHQTEI